MNYLFDLGHPAHFHLFKHLIFALKKDGHNVIIAAKDQPVLKELLTSAGLEFINLGRKGRTLAGKALKQLWFDWRVWQIARINKIDLGLGVSMSLPQAAIFSKMKSIVFDDDDYAVTPLFYRFAHHFADHVISPDCLSWQKSGGKYVYYRGYHELAYLHPDRFEPDPAVLVKERLEPGEPFFILRFNAFKAYHDPGHSGLSSMQKKQLLEKLLPFGRVFISGETDLLPEFETYKLTIPPREIHSLMAYATMYIGESQTMASEASVLGIPSIRINSFAGRISTLKELEEKYQLTFAFHPSGFEKMLEKVDELLAMTNLKDEFQCRKNRMLENKIDVTALFYRLVENYPGSLEKTGQDDSFWENFKLKI